MRSLRILNRNGFSLLEVLVAVAIMTIIAGTGIWASMSTYQLYHVYAEKSYIIGLISAAETEALISNNYQTVFIPRDQAVLITGPTTLSFNTAGELYSDEKITLASGSHLEAIRVNHDGSIF